MLLLPTGTRQLCGILYCRRCTSENLKRFKLTFFPLHHNQVTPSTHRHLHVLRLMTRKDLQCCLVPSHKSILFSLTTILHLHHPMHGPTGSPCFQLPYHQEQTPLPISHHYKSADLLPNRELQPTHTHSRHPKIQVNALYTHEFSWQLSKNQTLFSILSKSHQYISG